MVQKCGQLPGMVLKPCKINEINYQPQPVHDFSHQQYFGKTIFARQEFLRLQQVSGWCSTCTLWGSRSLVYIGVGFVLSYTRLNHHCLDITWYNRQGGPIPVVVNVPCELWILWTIQLHPSSARVYPVRLCHPWSQPPSPPKNKATSRFNQPSQHQITKSKKQVHPPEDYWVVVSNIFWFSSLNLGKMNLIWPSYFSDGLVETTNRRWTAGTWSTWGVPRIHQPQHSRCRFGGRNMAGFCFPVARNKTKGKGRNRKIHGVQDFPKKHWLQIVFKIHEQFWCRALVD